MEKVEVNTIEREIYEKYLLPIHKESILKWNQTQVPNILKLMAKDLVKRYNITNN